MIGSEESVAAKFKTPPAVTKTPDGKVKVEFTLTSPTDVEVAVLDSKGKVVRHLAAGMLNEKNVPPAPLQSGLSQTMEWDGKDDYNEIAKGGPFKIRVRAGMGVKLKEIVGGNPYAYYSAEMGQGDHAAWRVTGLEAKSDGKVYVLGNANNYGPPALRQYEADGSYTKTVYPPPAGKPIEKMKGWGLIEKEDKTYSLQFIDLASPALSMTPIAGTRGAIADIIPSLATDTLTLIQKDQVFIVNCDGTIPDKPILPINLINKESLSSLSILRGPMSIAYAPDGKSFYIDGVYEVNMEGNNFQGAKPKGFWRDGQVFKVDMQTRKPEVFFALDESKVITSDKDRLESPIRDAKYGAHAAIQGIAVDKKGNVFVCDRQNERVLVLDSAGKIKKEIPVKYPDMIAVHPNKNIIYVTTRYGHYHQKGEIKLLKFNDWEADAKPVYETLICKVQDFGQKTYMTVQEKGSEVYLWIAYTALPLQIYKDVDKGLELFKDFNKDGFQRCLDLQHMVVDPNTENVYISDGFKNSFMINDWKNPKFELCMVNEKERVTALQFAIDTRNQMIYAHDYIRNNVKYSLWRYKMEGNLFPPANVGDTGMNAISGQRVSNDWRIGLGLAQRGMAVGPDGSVVALGGLEHTDYSGPIYYFKRNEKAVPWEPVYFACFGNPKSAGVRFDPKGNLYVGKSGQGKEKPAIYRFKPTGSLQEGCLFPVAPEKEDKIYDVDYGYPAPQFSRTARFGVDGYGRIYYPSLNGPKVSMMDNEGNEILKFGAYGNRDSLGGLEGDLIPTKDVPMIFPNSVDATDDFIYVTDIVNIRLLRLAKTFILNESLEVK